jgi:6-phosphogluconate dehydrogenase
MQMVAALRGQFGGHPVMTVAQGNDLRNTVGVGDADPTLGIKAEKKRAGSARKAAVHGRKAAAAGPSSGTGSTTARSERRTTKRTGTPGGRDAASAGPTSGTGSAT